MRLVNRYLKLIAGLLVIAFGTGAVAQSPTTEPTDAKVDEFVRNGMAQLDIPGVAIARIEGGVVRHVRGFGRVDGSGAAVTAQTPFQLGSVSKSFVALVVLQLADEGGLSLDAPVSTYVPGFQTSDKAMSDRITVRHLLDHRSGFAMLDGNRYQDTTYRGADALDMVVRRLRTADLHAEPGRQFEYSNANYALAAALIEAVEKRPFEDVLRARIFTPLGMKNSYVQVHPSTAARRAIGHTQWFGKTVERDFVAGRMMTGPGGVTASAEDLATYLIAVFEKDPRILSRTLAAAIDGNRAQGYEFGWSFDVENGERTISHSGLNPGFHAMVKYLPGRRQGVVVLSNMSGSFEGNFAVGTGNYLLGLPDVDISLPNESLMRFVGATVAALFFAVGGVLAINRLWKKSVRSSGPASRYRPLWSVATSLILLALAYGLAVVVPEQSGVNLAAIRTFYPDIGLMITIAAVSAALWAVALQLLRSRRGPASVE